MKPEKYIAFSIVDITHSLQNQAWEFRFWTVLWVTQINNWTKWFKKVRSILSTIHTSYYLIKHEHIQHTRKSLWEQQNKTRSNRTGSLASSCSNVFLWKHGFRASTADTNKRSISNRIYCLLLGNSS